MKKIAAYLKTNKLMLTAIFALALPSIIEQAMQTIIQYVDAAMVGQMGAKASAAVGLTSPITWLVNAPMFAISIGFLACISRSIGAKDEKTARTAAMQSIFAVLILGGAVGILTVGLSPFIPGWMNADQDIYRDAALYFAIICAPMLFRASTVIFGSALRASGDTRTPMLISIAMNIIHIVCNYFLIFAAREVSMFGAEFTIPGAGLGVIGAAISTAISHVISGTAMFIMLMLSPKLSPRGMKLKLDRPVMGQCIRIGLPVTFTRIGVSLGHVVFLAQVTKLGTIALAAHSLALTVESAIYLPGYGMQIAASTLVGNAVGERDEKKLMRVSRTVALIAALMMTVTGALLFALPGQLMSIFTPDADVIASGITILRIIALTEPIYAIGIIFEGVFNGVGDTRAPFVISVATMWGIRIFFTYLCINVWGLGLNAVWMCMAANNVMNAGLLTVRYLRGSWKRRLGI